MSLFSVKSTCVSACPNYNITITDWQLDSEMTTQKETSEMLTHMPAPAKVIFSPIACLRTFLTWVYASFSTGGNIRKRRRGKLIFLGKGNCLGCGCLSCDTALHRFALWCTGIGINSPWVLCSDSPTLSPSHGCCSKLKLITRCSVSQWVVRLCEQTLWIWKLVTAVLSSDFARTLTNKGLDCVGRWEVMLPGDERREFKGTLVLVH